MLVVKDEGGVGDVVWWLVDELWVCDVCVCFDDCVE